MPRKVKVDSHGDDLGSPARIAAQAVQFVRYCVQWQASNGSSPALHSVTLYPPAQSRNGMWLVVGKGWNYSQRVVAFHRAPDPLTALLGFFTKVAAGTMVWKADSYAERK